MNTTLARTCKDHSMAAMAAAVAAALTIGFASSPAHSAEFDQDAPQVTVRFAESDVASDAGASALHRRIVSAARNVCRDGGARGVAAQVAAQRCVESAVANAVARIGSPQLAAVHARAAVRG